MIDINTVREKYASMQDSELILFFNEEGSKLTDESSDLLIKEINKRNLYRFITPGLNINDEKSYTFESIEYNSRDENFPEHAWTYAFDLKEQDKSNAYITGVLFEIGMSEESALLLLSRMEAVAKLRIKKAEHDKLIGGLILVSGIAITLLPLRIGTNRLTYIVAWTAILLGALLFIKGIFNKSRFKKIVQNITPRTTFDYQK